MLKALRLTTAAVLLSATALAGAAHADTDGQPTTATIDAAKPGPVYHKEVFT